MAAPTKGARLGGSPAHERMILANLATELFRHKSIRTTETRAKRLQPEAEKLITLAKKGDLASRRRAMRVIRDKSVVYALFDEIAPTFAERPGGYTRITKVGPRKGDNAPMAVIELVQEQYSPKQAVVKEAEGATKGAAKKKADESAAAEAEAVNAEASEAADEAATTESVDAESVEAEQSAAAADAEAPAEADAKDAADADADDAEAEDK